MDIANLAIGFLKDFGLTVRRYVYYQIYHNNYVSEFQNIQERLKARHAVVEANLRTQLNQWGKITNNEVEIWLEQARQEIAEEVIKDLICKGGCFTYIFSSRKLDKKTQAVNEGIFKQGEKYANASEILVIDDQSVQHYVGVFEEKQKEVKHQREKIEANLKTQLRQPGKIVVEEVKEWLEKASEQVTMKAEDLINQGECSSSTNLKKRTGELERILEKGKEFTNAGEILVVDDHSKKGVPILAENCIARDEVQEEILQLLRGDEVTRIAVCGMGGVGKTTIMKQVYNQLLKEPKFNKVIWVKVSKDFDIVVLQKKQFDILKFQKSIARKLGLDLKNEDQEAAEFAGLISDKLQQGSHVLILDDVWEPFSLEAVGIPDLVGNNGCKLVLTTRLQQEVGRAMECEVIQVKPLPDDKALALFLDKVGSEVVSYPRYKRDVEPFLNQILKKCKGVPLAIGIVAKTMRGKVDRYLWQNAAEKFSKSEEIVDRLKFSYDHLEEQYQKCFLYCALYPEDHEILKEELIELCIEEGFIIDESGSQHSMICEGHVIFEKLIDNCMLELVKKEEEPYWPLRVADLVKYKAIEDRVSMHDLLREMALNVSPQFMTKAGMALEELPEEHEWRKDLLKVSLMNNNIREIPSSMSSPKCPMLTTLLLSNNNITTIPEAFFDQMLGLKILDLSNNDELDRLPSSISKLENLTTLLLENCESLKEVPSLYNLGGLKRLNLFGTSLEELPQGFSMLTNLKYLWLGGRLSEIPDGLLRNLSKLQYLGVDWSTPLKWEEIGRLSKLESISGRFSTLDDMSLFVKPERKFPDWYRIFVGSYNKDDEFRHFDTIAGAMKLIVCCHIDICKEPNWFPSDVQGFFILDCKDLRSLNDISGLQEATDLQHCTIDKCDGLEYVVSSRCLKLIQNLELLNLNALDNLSAVFGEVGAVAKSAPLPAGTFSSLQKIEVHACGKIKKLLPLRLLRYLQNLQIIYVRWCDQMEEIIWSDYEEGEKAPEKLTLPKLESLQLEVMKSLKSIYSGSSTILICDSLQKISMVGCHAIESVFWKGFNPLSTLKYLELRSLGNLKSVFDEKALGLSAPPTTFFSLKIIDVNNCSKLKKVFSSGWLSCYFQSLEGIHVFNCEQMEELISTSSYEEKKALEKITLPNLQCLSLYLLPKLKSICSSSNVLISNSIETLRIYDCQKLKRIPLHLSSLDNGQPPPLKAISVYPKACWESLEWDQSNAKDVLQSFVDSCGDD